MFPIGHTTQIHLATGVTDLRKGFQRLYCQIQSSFGRDPHGGDLFVFCNRRRDAIKVFFADTDGFWVCMKRLEAGTYRWPEKGEVIVTLSAAELTLLLSGIDLAGSRRRQWWRKAEKK